MSANDAEQSDVLIGREGRLFLIGGRHEVRTLFTAARVTPESVSNFFDNQRRRAEYCAHRAIDYRMVVFPDKIYAERAFLDFAVNSLFLKAYMAGAAPNAREGLLYPVEAIGDGGYYLTDTHLNPAGVIAVALALAQSGLSVVCPPIEQFRTALDAQVSPPRLYCGDLGRKFDPPVEEQARVFSRSATTELATNGLAAGNDGMLVIARNDAAMTSAKLLIFGDSFFRQLIAPLSL